MGKSCSSLLDAGMAVTIELDDGGLILLPVGEATASLGCT
jgi:hypothetical protein